MEGYEMRLRVRDAARRAYAGGLVTGTSGNVSEFDRESGLMVITPTSLPYDVMEPEDVVLMDLDGTVRDGCRAPSSEWRLHAELYRGLGDVSAVIHTHSPMATAFAVLRRPIPLTLVEMLLFLGGEVPVAELAVPGTAQVGETAVQAMASPRRNACLLANHGVAAVGRSLDEAYIRAQYVEEAAVICHAAMQMGQPYELPPETVCQLREKYGLPD